MNVVVRLLAWMVVIALIVTPVAFVLNRGGGQYWPLRRLEVSGPFHRVSAEQVREVVLPQAKAGFFAVRMNDITAAVAAMPWVEHVEVRRRWPDQLVVHFTEHHAFARWGQDRLLSDHGRVFSAPGSPDLASLPALDGPDTRSADVVALYNQILPLFAGTNAKVLGVSLSDRDSWTVHLGNGVDVVVGRNDALERLRRFAHLLPRLTATRQGSTLLRADLRYTNGFALSWQDPTPTKPAGSKRPAAAGSKKTQART